MGDVRQTICHEWGHALMIYLLGFKDSLNEIVILSADEGYCSHEYYDCFGSESVFVSLAGVGAELVCGYKKYFGVNGRWCKESDIEKVYVITDDPNVIWEHKKWVKETLMPYKRVLEVLVDDTLLFYSAEHTGEGCLYKVPKDDIVFCIESAMAQVEDDELEVCFFCER